MADKPFRQQQQQQHNEGLRRRKEVARQLEAQRAHLPITIARDELVKEIMAHDCTVVVGETGSGKTTQIPQFLMDAGLTRHGAIAITQPRRVAATSIAKRVSEEVGCVLGKKVGYAVRFDDTSSPSTELRYMTDGIYSTIILDEAHERTLRTDILLGMVKRIQQQRKALAIQDPEHNHPLKIIVMSATLDAERFSEYFNGAKILYVSGRLHPVTTFHTTTPHADYLDAALVTIFQIHQEQAVGDILVFLTGQEDIESLDRLIRDYAARLPEDSAQLLPCPIFSALPPSQQARVFNPAPPNTRKVVLATNIAETSITISGIRYVIDTGLAKVRAYDARVGMETLLVQPISKSSARQRAGRAGREAAGTCYRLYMADTYEDLTEDAEPEIKRCNLASVILNIKASGCEDVLSFDFLDRPSRDGCKLLLNHKMKSNRWNLVIRALEQLFALGALKENGTLADSGRRMAELPLDPTYARVLFQAELLGCVSEVIDVIALLSVDSLFYASHEQRDQALEARRPFTTRDGDHLTLLNVLTAYRQMDGDREWCRQHYIQIRAMTQIMDVRKQLAMVCQRLGMDPQSSCGPERELVLRCFLAGFFQNTALRQLDGTYRSVVGGQTVSIHPMSSLFGQRAEAIMYDELVFTTRQYARGVSAIKANWLPEAAPNYFDRVRLNQVSS
ncbi:putative ATP-dependent RNA helicase prh1 [Syncephalis fuscata]|nr:putative ATP-dependent RNA helicase prh1 [Syncephalis fuscata]